MKFFEGQIVHIQDSRGDLDRFEIHKGPEGEPYRHRVLKSGKISTRGVRVKITDRLKT